MFGQSKQKGELIILSIIEMHRVANSNINLADNNQSLTIVRLLKRLKTITKNLKRNEQMFKQLDVSNVEVEKLLN